MTTNQVQPGPSGPLEVLYVDEDVSAGARFARQLEAAGCHVATVTDADSALALGHERAFDVVLIRWDLAEEQYDTLDDAVLRRAFGKASVCYLSNSPSTLLNPAVDGRPGGLTRWLSEQFLVRRCLSQPPPEAGPPGQ